MKWTKARVIEAVRNLTWAQPRAHQGCVIRDEWAANDGVLFRREISPFVPIGTVGRVTYSVYDFPVDDDGEFRPWNDAPRTGRLRRRIHLGRCVGESP